MAIRLEDTAGTLRARAFADSSGMLYEAVDRLEQPGFQPPSIDALGPVYTLPNFRQWVLLNARVGRRRLRARTGRRRRGSR